MPTRSRFGYTRCPECRRHVLALGEPSEFACPFCLRRPRVGFRTRSAVLAGALVLAGCGASETEPSETPTETPNETPRYEPADDPAMGEVYGAPPEDDSEPDDTPEEE